MMLWVILMLFATACHVATTSVWQHPTVWSILLGMFAYPGLFLTIYCLISRGNADATSRRH